MLVKYLVKVYNNSNTAGFKIDVSLRLLQYRICPFRGPNISLT